MRYYTHLAFGFLVGLLTYKLVPINTYIFFFIVLLGALLPDVDCPNSKFNQKVKITKIIGYLFKHRGIFHSIFLAILLPGIIWLVIGPLYGVALFIGYMSHLLIDGLTLAGVNFLHPLTTLRIHGFIKTGGFLEKAVFVLIVVGIGFTLI